jgi:hypothetical protein
VLRKRISLVLLKGKSEGGKQAIALQLIECDRAWQLLPKRTSAFLLKGNFEGGKQAIAWKLIQCDLA